VANVPLAVTMDKSKSMQHNHINHLSKQASSFFNKNLTNADNDLIRDISVTPNLLKS